MAADYTFQPTNDYSPKIAGEKTTINELEDLSELRLRQGETIGGTYTENYRMTGPELALLMGFWETRQDTESFTKLNYDPRDPAFDPDDPGAAAGPVTRVRFLKPPIWKMRAPDDYTVRVIFKTLPNE